MEIDAKTFWERFEFLRKRQGLMIMTVEKIAGLSVGRISTMKSRQIIPSLSEALRLCEALNCPYEYLFKGTFETSQLNEMVSFYSKYLSLDEQTQYVIKRLLELESKKR